ncbi:MAG TPA: MBL fold metallo-hydrolase [Kofleriaceae bacterium]|nr:MBL fold metallo-hydrolase [Kofleriaceae bacterium]
MRWLAVLLALAGCRPDPAMTVPRSAHGVAIGTVTLQWSNVHAVLGEHVLIVDSGARGDFHELTTGLRTLGVRLADVKCAVITHGHADHAGTARAMQLAGITIIAGAADLDRTTRGFHGPHHPTGIFSWLLKFFLPEHYTPFTADVQVTAEMGRYDLRPVCGIDGEVIAMPGHTAGSLVVVVGGGKVALVGDLFRGGQLAGMIHKHEPMVHFYQDDRRQAHAQIRALLARGVETFVLGHGGPASRADVERVFGDGEK